MMSPTNLHVIVFVFTDICIYICKYLHLYFQQFVIVLEDICIHVCKFALHHLSLMSPSNSVNDAIVKPRPKRAICWKALDSKAQMLEIHPSKHTEMDGCDAFFFSFFESMLFFSYFDFIFAFKALLLSLKAWIKKGKGFISSRLIVTVSSTKLFQRGLFCQACMLSVQNYGLVKSPPGVDCANATTPNFITNWSKIRPNSELFVLVRFSTLPWCEFCWHPDPKSRLDDFKKEPSKEESNRE